MSCTWLITEWSERKSDAKLQQLLEASRNHLKGVFSLSPIEDFCCSRSGMGPKNLHFQQVQWCWCSWSRDYILWDLLIWKICWCRMQKQNTSMAPLLQSHQYDLCFYVLLSLVSIFAPHHSSVKHRNRCLFRWTILWKLQWHPSSC